MKIKTRELTGVALRVAAAQADGYVWVRNGVKRSGDSLDKYQQGSKWKGPQWPIGARCLVSPSKAGNLHPEHCNWDGWLPSDGTEPLAPAALYGVPHFETNWAHGGPIIDRADIDIERDYDRVFDADERIEPFIANKQGPDGRWYSQYGATRLEAGMRCFVEFKLGDEVDVPEELLA
jgi:hypothetical protein